jgi:SsrA-binding protein
MAKKPETASRIADNKKAAFNYFFEERFEAGLVLHGWEVKALREGKVQLTDGYVVIREGELYLIGCQINPLKPPPPTSVPKRRAPRSCCCTKDEIKRLIGKVEQKGYTLVPLNLHWKTRARQSATLPWPKARPSTTSATPSKTAKASARWSAS